MDFYSSSSPPSGDNIYDILANSQSEKKHDYGALSDPKAKPSAHIVHVASSNDKDISYSGLTQFEMTESPVTCHGNLAYEVVDKPTSSKSFQVKEITNQTEESGHSNQNHCNQYKVLNPEKANPAQGSNRGLLVLVIVVCLISLVALLLTILMLVGKIGSSNEGSYSVSAKSLQTYSAKIKALEENITSLQLGLSQQCVTPCNPANNSVYGKEGMKGETAKKGEKGDTGEKGKKGDKGDSGANCTHTVQDPNKPSAHIEALNKNAGVYYLANTVIKDWSVSAPHSHLEGGMKYHDGNLTVPIPGRYYIYTQLYYHSSGSLGRVYVRVNSQVVTMIQPLDIGKSQSAVYAGGVFNLKAGDVISLYVVHSIKIFMSSAAHSYFGAFVI